MNPARNVRIQTSSLCNACRSQPVATRSRRTALPSPRRRRSFLASTFRPSAAFTPFDVVTHTLASVLVRRDPRSSSSKRFVRPRFAPALDVEMVGYELSPGTVRTWPMSVRVPPRPVARGGEAGIPPRGKGGFLDGHGERWIEGVWMDRSGFKVPGSTDYEPPLGDAGSPGELPGSERMVRPRNLTGAGKGAFPIVTRLERECLIGGASIPPRIAHARTPRKPPVLDGSETDTVEEPGIDPIVVGIPLRDVARKGASAVPLEDVRHVTPSNTNCVDVEHAAETRVMGLHGRVWSYAQVCTWR